jgi:hypothetical protein
MPRSGRWPWGLLGMLALVVAVESTVARHRFEFLDMTSVTWALSGRAAVSESLKGRSSSGSTPSRSNGRRGTRLTTSR